MRRLFSARPSLFLSPYSATPNSTIKRFFTTLFCLMGFVAITQAQSTMYGMTTDGGGYGTLFSITTNGTFKRLHYFDWYHGSTPVGSLVQAANGKLYGATEADANYAGTVFSYDPSTSSYAVVKYFDDVTGPPEGGLVLASDGKLYGTTDGDRTHFGVIFSIDPASGAYAELHSFAGGTEGGYPAGNLIQAQDGKLYGTTPGTGTGGNGLVFSFDLSNNNQYTVLYRFAGGANGARPIGRLLQTSNGTLYGKTVRGGANSNGVIFSLTTTGAYTVLNSFPGGLGNYSSGSLMQASNGKFYGTTYEGGTSDKGTIYSFDPSSNQFATLKSFGITDGSLPSTRLIEVRGKLYGTAWGGGQPTDEYNGGWGVVFSFDPSNNAYTVMKSFGAVYGGLDGIHPTEALTAEYVLPPGITTAALSSGNFCAGASLSVSYTATGTFTAGNTFTVQLSNASGSFSSATAIGSVSATANGSINVTIPANTMAGTGYRIRVVSSSPVVTGSRSSTDIAINAVPTAPSLSTQTFCSSDNSTVGWLPQNGNYTWYQNATGGIALDAATALISGSLYVSETRDGCQGPRAAVTVTISTTPVLVITNPHAICGTATVNLTAAAITAGSTLPSGTTLEYYSVDDGTTVEDPEHIGPGTYTITAVYGVCYDSKEVTVTVNPQPQVYTIGGGGTYCSDGSGVNITVSNSESGINYNLLLSGNTTPVATQAGNGTTLTFLNVTTAGTYTIQAVNASTTCSITMTGSANVAINPAPTVDAVSNATYCNKDAGTAIAFSGTVAGTTFTWGSSADVGFGTNGNGNIGAYTATNTTGEPVIATITVTPHYTSGGITCDGALKHFTVTINPTPTAVAGAASQAICSGTAISSITLSGAVSSTMYNWTRDNTTNITGIGSSGNGDISGTLSTTFTSAQTTKFTITPSANGCTGTAIIASVVVNPLTYISTPPAAFISYAAANTSFSVLATGTGTLGYKWQVNTGSGWNDLANGGVYSNVTTNTLNLTSLTYAMNGYLYRSVVSGDCGTATSTAAALTVNKRPVTLVYTGITSVQYSDQVSLSATFSDKSSASTSADLSGRKITFTIGIQTATATTNSSGAASTTLIITQAPANYTVVVSFDGSSDLVYQSSTLTPAASLVVNKEDARSYYTGSLFASTSGATASTATLTLSATIKDITAVSGDARYDAFAGDVRNAKVMFVNRDAGNAPISGWLTPVLISATDLKTGTVTFNWSVNIGTQNSQSYNIGMVVDAPGYYTQNSSADDQIVTVSKPLPDFVTGGGYLVMQTSAGLKAGDVGLRNNFGFSVKYNKSGTNLQGNFNAIVRRTESDGKQHVYQIKSNSMASLAVNAAKTTTHPYPTAVFDGKASIQDITNPLAAVSVDGGASLHVTITDKGDPGNTDGIAITVWNKSGGLWFSSNWNSTTTIEQTLAGGNLKVSTNRSFSSGSTVANNFPLVNQLRVIQERYAGKLNVTVSPNPSRSYFTLHTQSGSDKPVQVRTVDALGRQIEVRINVPANGTLMLGGNYRPGIYFTEVLQGNERITLKLIKQPV